MSESLREARQVAFDAHRHGYFEVSMTIRALVAEVESLPGRFADLVEGLSEVYTREGVHIWLTGRHRLLDQRAPLDVIREPGGLERVEALLDQLLSGAHV